MKYRQLIIGVFGIASAFIGPVSFASNERFECAQPQWDFQTFNSQDELNAEISKVCRIAFNAPRSLQGVLRSMSSRLTSIYQEVGTSSPVVFSGLQGFSYPVTLFTSDRGGTDSIKGTYRVGIHEDGQYLMSLFESHSIRGTGNGKYLKSFSEKIEIRSQANEDRTFEVRIAETFVLDKPSFLIPDQLFKVEADEAISKEFDHELQTTLEQIRSDFDSSRIS